MANIDRYTISYRTEEASQVMEWVLAGQCGNIIGLRGVGKSNFLQFLIRENVKQHFLGQEAEDFHFILIILLSLTERTVWGLYELLLGSLVGQLHPPDRDNTILEKMSRLHRDTLGRRDAIIAQRAFEHCVTLLSLQTQRLIFVFDEFDDLFRNLPVALFSCLRAIRDAQKEQISLIVVSAQELAGLRDQSSENVDHFSRLVSRNICWLGMHSERDAGEMIHYLAARRNRVVGESYAKQLIVWSGGYAGLLKIILSIIWSREYKSASFIDLTEVMNEASIRRECSKLWESLASDERVALCSFVNGESIPSQMLAHLMVRCLLRRSNGCKDFFHRYLLGL
jgi:hypothetical protein